MEKHTEHLAAEILALEQTHQSSGLSDEQLKHWRALVCELLARVCPRSERRKDLRVPTNIRATLRKGDRSYDCQIVDLHRTAVAVAGELAELAEGDGVELESFHVDESVHYTKIPGRIVRKEASHQTNQIIAGVELSDVEKDTQQRFFNIAFYPAYIRYLEQLAAP